MKKLKVFTAEFFTRSGSWQTRHFLAESKAGLKREFRSSVRNVQESKLYATSFPVVAQELLDDPYAEAKFIFS